MFIDISDIKKSYGAGESRVEVLKGISFGVEKGEFCVLLGPSGSGKSTLLNIIGGIDDADSGYISINGEKIENMKEKALTDYRRRHLGYIFQMYNLIPNLNIKENVETGAYLSDHPLDVDDILKTLGLYEHRHKLPSQLSGGQQQSAHRQLLHRIGVGAGGIEYHDARLGAAVQGDIVDAGPGPGDGQKVFRKIIVHQLGGADQDGVLVCLRIGDGVQRRIQAVQADGRDLVECSDTVHGRMPPLGGPSGSRYLRGNVRCWHRFRRSIFYYR